MFVALLVGVAATWLGVGVLVVVGWRVGIGSPPRWRAYADGRRDAWCEFRSRLGCRRWLDIGNAGDLVSHVRGCAVCGGALADIVPCLACGWRRVVERRSARLDGRVRAAMEGRVRALGR